MEIRKCKICGKEFVVSSKNKRVCSDECRRVNKNLTSKRFAMKQAEEKRKTPKISYCENCGKAFSPKNSRHLRCTPNCGEDVAVEEVKKLTPREQEKLRKKKLKELIDFNETALRGGRSYGKLEMQSYLAKQSEEMARHRRELEAEFKRRKSNGN